MYIRVCKHSKLYSEQILIVENIDSRKKTSLKSTTKARCANEIDNRDNALQKTRWKAKPAGSPPAYPPHDLLIYC